MNHYFSILRVKPGADMAEIKNAYRKAVLRYHPDSNDGIGDTDKFKDTVKAYHEIQKHYKSLGLKKPKRWQTAFAAFVAKVTFFQKLPKRASARERSRKRKVYRGGYVDARVSSLSFEELRLRFFESSNGFVKKQAARALAICHGFEALAIFESELKVAEPYLVAEIIFCLGLVDHKGSVKILETYLRNEDIKIACAAVNALQNINRRNAKNILKKIEKEGRALKHVVVRFFESRRVGKLVKRGFIARSEFHIAKALRVQTGQPLPAILRQLGWEIPAGI